MKPQSLKDIIKMSPEDYSNYLAKEYLNNDIPLCCDTLEELAIVGDLYIYNVNSFSYLVSVANGLKVQIRNAKRQGNKILAEDLIDKNYCLQNCIDVISKREKLLSRLITIKQMENQEIYMSGKL